MTINTEQLRLTLEEIKASRIGIGSIWEYKDYCGLVKDRIFYKLLICDVVASQHNKHWFSFKTYKIDTNECRIWLLDYSQVKVFLETNLLFRGSCNLRTI